jgi:hypothetical protein
MPDSHKKRQVAAQLRRAFEVVELLENENTGLNLCVENA